MSSYPKAVAYLKRCSSTKKLTNIYKLDLLEKVLNVRDFEDYLSIKTSIHNSGGGHIRVFDLLFSEWLNNSISKDNINVYKGIFAEGQDIRYFRDYFSESNEETTYNSKGNLTEFKAYGDSLKINREVIAFEGRFYDDKLTTYTDKTLNAVNYISDAHLDDDIDFYSHKETMLTVLITNNCIDIVEDRVIEDIFKSNMTSGLLSLLLERKLYNLLTKTSVHAIVKKGLLTDLLSNLIENKQKDYIQNILQNYILPEDLKMEDIFLLSECDCLNGLSKEYVEQIISSNLPKSEITNLEQIVKNKLFYYDNENLDFMLPIYNYTEGKAMGIPVNILSVSTEFKNLGPMSKECYRLKDIIQYFKNNIEKNYILNPKYENDSWNKEIIERLRPFCKGDSDAILLKQLDQISKLADNKVSQSNSINRSHKIKKLIKRIVIIAIFAGIGYLIWVMKQESKVEDLSSLTNTNTNITDTLQNQEPSFPTTPGNYYVSEDALDGVTLYKDVKKKKKLSYRLSNMENITIAKIEDSMGFFESYMNDNYDDIPRGWVELKYLKSQKESVYSLGDSYRVKSEHDNIPIYKDYLKKKKLKFKLQSMDRINVTKTIGGMAYLKGLFINTNKINGWVELDKIEKYQ